MEEIDGVFLLLNLPELLIADVGENCAPNCELELLLVAEKLLERALAADPIDGNVVSN